MNGMWSENGDGDYNVKNNNDDSKKVAHVNIRSFVFPVI